MGEGTWIRNYEWPFNHLVCIDNISATDKKHPNFVNGTHEPKSRARDKKIRDLENQLVEAYVENKALTEKYKQISSNYDKHQTRTAELKSELVMLTIENRLMLEKYAKLEMAHVNLIDKNAITQQKFNDIQLSLHMVKNTLGPENIQNLHMNMIDTPKSIQKNKSIVSAMTQSVEWVTYKTEKESTINLMTSKINPAINSTTIEQNIDRSKMKA